MIKRRFASSAFATMLNLIIQFSISFFLTSYIVETLGEEEYGFFSLANNIVNYALIITSALNSMSARFIGYELHNGRTDKALKYYASVLFGNIIFSVLLIIPALLGVIYLQHLINIPANIVREVKLLFLIVFVSLCCNLIFAVFGGVYTIKNRMDVLGVINICANVTKALVLVAMYWLLKPSIIYMGIATLVAALVLGLGNLINKKRYCPELKFSIKNVNGASVKEILVSGIWNSLNQLSITLLHGLDLLLANLMVSSVAMGVLSVANTLPGVITTCISALAALYMPKFLEYFSHDDYGALLKEAKNSIRFMTVISCIPIGFLIAFGQPFFRLWTPSTDTQMVYNLSLLVILPQFSGGAINSFNYLYTAANKVKWQAIVLLLTGLINVSLVFILLQCSSLGVYAIAGVSAIMGLVRNYVFNAPYAAHCIKQPWYIFYMDMVKSLIALGLTVGLGFWVQEFFAVNSWLELLVYGAVSIGVGAIINILLVLSKEQKKELRQKIKGVFHRSNGD